MISRWIEKGFGFVEMGIPEDAQAAMDGLNQSVFEGLTLREFDHGGYRGGAGRLY